MESKTAVKVIYTNYRGETAIRRIVPKTLWFGSCEWYPDEQWLLDVFDVEREADRTFALKNLKAWLGPDE